MSVQVTAFLTLETLKNSLDISNTTHDQQLLEIAYLSNQEIDKILRPYASTVPITPGSPIFIHAARVASRYARTIWYERQGQTSRYEQSQKMYEAESESLIAAVKSLYPTRSRTIFLAGTNPLDRLYQPASTDEYTAREFF